MSTPQQNMKDLLQEVETVLHAIEGLTLALKITLDPIIEVLTLNMTLEQQEARQASISVMDALEEKFPEMWKAYNKAWRAAENPKNAPQSIEK